MSMSTFLRKALASAALAPLLGLGVGQASATVITFDFAQSGGLAPGQYAYAADAAGQWSNPLGTVANVTGVTFAGYSGVQTNGSAAQ